jgi:DNA-binding transcriptional LysR family regulator
VDTACWRAGFSPDGRRHANSIATQLAMVSCGIGVAIVPSLAARGGPDVAVRVLSEPAPLVALSLLVYDDADPLVEHFLTTVVPAPSIPAVIPTT